MQPLRYAEQTLATKQYKKAPIVEAAIEVRFEQPLSDDVVNSIHARMKSGFAHSEQISLTTVGVTLKPTNRQATVSSRDNGYRLASKDRTDILQITPNSMVCGRLAPYLGWERYRKWAASNWKTWRRVAGYRKIQRLGLRYINRIDIPADAGAKIRIEDYLNVYPEYPDQQAMPHLSQYTMQLVGPLDGGNFNLIINSGIMPPPLIAHSSFALDIDVVREHDVPQKDDDIWALFDVMREHKNRVFEACVTDKARKLFDE